MLGALLSVGGSLLGGMLGNKAADDRQEDAQSFNSAQFASRYQTTMADMKAAGLNPGLAYGGISGAPSPAGIASAPGFPDLGDSYNRGRGTDAQVRLQSATQANIEADTANKASQGRLYEAQAAAAMGSADQATAMTGQIGATVQKILAEIPQIKEQTLNLSEQRKVIRETVGMLAAQAELMTQQGVTQDSVRAQLRAAVQKLASETALNNFSIEAAEDMGNIGREAGQLKPIFDIIRSLMLRR